MLILAACGGTAATPTPAPAPTLGPLQYTTIPLNLPAAAYQAQLIGPLSTSATLTLGVSFKVNSSVLPKSTGTVPTGKQIDGSQLANAYGISDATYAKIKQFLGVKDVTLKLGALHSYMSVTAKVESIEELFQTRFQVYKLNKREYYVPAANLPPKLPTFIMQYVIAVTGLENYYTLTPDIDRQTTSTTPLATRQGAATCVGAQPGILVPQQISSAYGYTSFTRQGYTGKGVRVNLVELGGVAQSDLDNYFACVHFPTSNFSYEDVIQPAAQPDPDGTAEATLDIEMIASLAPAAQIVDYEAAIPNPQNSSLTLTSEFELLNQDLQAIIDDNILGNNGVNLVSISYGAAENYIDPNVVNSIDQSLQTLVSAEDMTVFVASGDCGAFETEQYGQLGVQFPSSDPWVTAVGGTVLAVNGQGKRAGEVTWGNAHPAGTTCTDNDWGSGGGVSQLFQQPTWQQGAGVKNRYTNGERQVPDLAAVAYDIPVYSDNQWEVVGGTSAATPIWASGMALVEQALLASTKQFVYGPNLFYAVANQASRDHPYNDIIHGNNLYYSATPDWDNTTGWGSPDMVNFYNALVSLL
jgi:kumamolisin